MDKRLRIEIGVFACNKAAIISETLHDLLAQEALRSQDTRILVLINGCTDDTPAIVDRIAQHHPSIKPIHLPKSGKSRAWNDFVHRESDPQADILVFSDADIRLPDKCAISALVDALQSNPALHAVNSQPVKDIATASHELTPVERLIAASAGSANDWRKAICGQLYAMPAKAARRYALPIGLPVEDGFLHAMICTDSFATPPTADRVDGSEARHIYESERKVGGLVRHQTRIIIGSAINEAIFRALSISDVDARKDMLHRASTDDRWLKNFLLANLPRWPYGYVSPHFLLKRSARALRSPRALVHPRRMVVFIAGVGFDLVVYIIAQVKMARGAGAGFW